MDNIIIKHISTITICQRSEGTDFSAIEIKPAASPLVSMTNRILRHENTSGELLMAHQFEWKDMFSPGTFFLVKGEFEDVNSGTKILGTYDLLADKFVEEVIYS